MRNLIDILDFSTEEIDGLIAVANDIIDNPDKYRDVCHGKILGTLFFEPSTRTRLSFTSAMMSLGGQEISNFIKINVKRFHKNDFYGIILLKINKGEEK